ncbi:MAG: Gldg family protein, partial [Planctomycetota bacterium]
MRFGAFASVLVTLALGLGVACLAVDVLDRTSGAVEVGDLRRTEVSDEERGFLAELPHPARLTYYVSPPSELPSSMRRLERDVVEILGAIAAAAPDRVAFEVVRSDRDPERIAFATARQLAPVNVRSVSRDRYTDRQVWSTLEVACGPRESAVLEGLTDEELPVLRALVLAQLRELIEPSEPRIAFAAPAGYADLRGLLSARGQVLDVDLDGGATLPEQADVLVWIQPSGPDPATVAEVDAFRERGRGVLIAASDRQSDFEGLDGQPAVRFSRRPLEIDALWEPFGLGAVDAPLLDVRSETVLVGQTQVQLPFLVRCIAPNQDFRGLGGQPNGSLLFSSPAPFVLDGAALRERRLTANVLATTSEAAWLATNVPAAGGSVPLEALQPSTGRPVPKQPL